MDLNDFKLCFVKKGTAYFTSHVLAEQWGDDWDDCPAIQNAGKPNTPLVYYLANGTTELSPDDWTDQKVPKWQIFEVRFSSINSRIMEPHEGANGEEVGALSVESYNACEQPWLRVEDWDIATGAYKRLGQLFAGASYYDFVQFIEKNEGTVWVPRAGLETTLTPGPMTDCKFREKLAA